MASATSPAASSRRLTARTPGPPPPGPHEPSTSCPAGPSPGRGAQAPCGHQLQRAAGMGHRSGRVPLGGRQVGPGHRDPAQQRPETVTGHGRPSAPAPTPAGQQPLGVGYVGAGSLQVAGAQQRVRVPDGQRGPGADQRVGQLPRLGQPRPRPRTVLDRLPGPLEQSAARARSPADRAWLIASTGIPADANQSLARRCRPGTSSGRSACSPPAARRRTGGDSGTSGAGRPARPRTRCPAPDAPAPARPRPAR